MAALSDLSTLDPDVVIVDLQTIVMKCLERDPSRRYESARALSALGMRPEDAKGAEALKERWKSAFTASE